MSEADWPHGPRKRESRKPEGSQRVLNLFNAQISFSSEAFAQFIRGQGVRVVHFRAAPDPTAMQSRGDPRPVDGTRHSSDGYIYEEAGVAHVLFHSNSAQETMPVEGVIDYSTAFMTLPAYYEQPDGQTGTTPILVMPWDRFYLKDIEVRVVDRQIVEPNSTGTDRLRYPATFVEFLQDAAGVKYNQDEHFVITEQGYIKWISQHRPGWNAELNRGVPYSIRYRYTPYFVCQRLLHEIRISQITDQSTQERKVERMPYSLQVVRENAWQDINNDVEAHGEDPRFAPAPPSGGMLGPTG
jgi:hypothetical protein